MTFETELRDRLHAGVDQTEIDLGALLDGSVAYGTRVVRRRRLFRIFAGAATVAVLGGVFAYAGSLSGPTDDGVPASTSTPALQEAITPQAALKILLETLPTAGQKGDFTGWPEGIGTQNGLSARLGYTDGGSTATVTISLLNHRFPPECVEGADLNCRIDTLANGSKLQLVENQSSGSSGNYKHLQANLYRKDGLVITLLSENREEYNPGTSPSRPPLSLAQLKAVVISPRWQRQVDPALVDGATGLFTPLPLTQPSSPASKGSK